MEGEVVELYELHYSDLIQLSSEKACEQMESISTSVMENLGPDGPGLLAVTGVPEASNLRRDLLPLAPKLALLNNDVRKHLLKEHNLGSDVPLKNPNRNVSSFSMQLKYEQCFERSDCWVDDVEVDNQDQEEAGQSEFKKLGCAFKELGYCMMDLGLRIARICDKVIGGHELQQSLLESGTAKGRLIHYHSTMDNDILRAKARNGKVNKNVQASLKQQGIEVSKDQSSGHGLWQQWHYDYGIFTLLTVPMFLLSSYQETASAENNDSPVSSEHEFPSPSGHTCLQIFDPKKNEVFMVKAPSESLILQVGEAADILSKGKLRATLHCVCRPPKIDNLSRETFVVFLQPAWSKQFSLSDYPLERLNLSGQQCREGTEQSKQVSEELSHEIRKIVPPLLSRLKDGMTFTEFSRETTKQYYGDKGLQSNR